VPVVGGPVFGIVLGMLFACARPPGAALRPGISFAGRFVLQMSIVLLGATLQLQQIARSGAESLPVLFGSAIVTLAAAYVSGRLLGIDRDLRRLLGIGTTICGGSAIAALASVIAVDETQVAYAISTVFFFNVVAVLTFPWIGHLIALSQHAFGLWAGTAVNDTSSVVAAGYVYGNDAGNAAVIVKLTRTVLIVPIVMFYAGKRMWQARSAAERVPWRRIVPWFIVWFAAAALLNTAGAIPPAAHAAIAQAAMFLIVVALCGVGLSVNGAAIRAAGARPLLLGLLLWIVIAVTSLAIAHITHVA
jgi:uncharacterized integral membrane protein (TIGR00698 family)